MLIEVRIGGCHHWTVWLLIAIGRVRIGHGGIVRNGLTVVACCIGGRVSRRKIWLVWLSHADLGVVVRRQLGLRRWANRHDWL